MEAKDRRARHYRSSVGLMLNENYGDGLIPNTVQSQDFHYVPPTDFPVSGLALDFLRDRLRTPHFHKPRSMGTSDSLYQAYRRAFAQPTGMVHYDREPLYWKSKNGPGSDLGSSKSLDSNGLRNFDDAIFNGCQKGPGIPDVHAASTVKSVSTAKSVSTTAKSVRSAATGATSRSSATTATATADGDDDGYRVARSKIPAGRLEDNRHRLWTPGPEAAGFKPYSPFSDSLQDFGKKEAKYIAPEIKPEFDRTCDVIPAPVYKDALNYVLDIDPGADGKGQQPIQQQQQQQRDSAVADKKSKKSTPDVLKLHGNPEYPQKVMDDKDVPNYVAWAKIYPYCPLTQVEGKDTPVFVPPRGFTPSIHSSAGTIVKLRDKKKEKRKILEGIKLLSSSSNSRRGGRGRDQQNRNQTNAASGNSDIDSDEAKNNPGEIHPSLKSLPPSLAAKLTPMIKREEDKALSKNKTTSFNDINHNTSSCSSSNNNNTNKNSKSNHKANAVTFHPNDTVTGRGSKGNGENTPPSSSLTLKQVTLDTSATRRLLDMKMKAPTGWYGGQTPTHTPTPEPSLPIKATGAWINHYSPARIRRFMRAVAGDHPTPEPHHF